jgi:hypothetical protein
MPIHAFSRRLVLLTTLTLVPAGAAAQDWAAAYDRGDYATASTLLHRMVLETDDTLEVDPAATGRLGQMYAEGRGVRQDLVMACALFNLGLTAATYRHHPYDPVAAPSRDVRDAEEVRDRQCGRLTDQQREEAMLLVGAVFVGPEEQTFDLATGHWIQVSRRGVHIDFKGATRFHHLPVTVNHGQQVAMVRHSVVQPPAASPDLGPRHFLEFFVWMSGPDSEGGLRRILVWNLTEVNALSLKPVVEEALIQGTGSIWPAAGVPADVREAVRLEMQSDGRVRWILPGEPARAGIVGGQ